MRNLDSAAYCTLLRRKIKTGAIRDGRKIHEELKAAGSDGETFPGNLLVQLYGECGCLDEALLAFRRIIRKNVFSWTALMGAHNKSGCLGEVRDLLARMPCHNAVALTAAVVGHAQAGHMDEAKTLFDSIPDLSVVSCNVMINAYGQNGVIREAETMFDLSSMPFEPDANSWMALLGSCKTHGDVARGGRAARAILQLDPRNFAACRLWSSTLPSSLDEELLADEYSSFFPYTL